MFKTQLKKKIGKLDTDFILSDEQFEELEELLQLCLKHLSKVDENLIIKAFHWCVIAYENKVRHSGKQYYTHPLAVAKIIVEEMPIDDVSVACALLHDLLDYSDKYTLKDLRNEFGTTVAEVVDGITKIRHIEGYGLDRFDKIENYQRLLLSLFKDVRIILIKLADRLHNMRTLKHIPEEKKKYIAKETIDIYSQFANRFGLCNIKWELEDLSFKYLHQEEYYKIKDSIHGTRKERESYITAFIDPVKERLDSDKFIKKNSIKYELKGRIKHIYSTYYKLINRGLSIDELNDLYAIRLVIDNEDPNICFLFYGIICELYKPVPGTFKNYIYLPKKNGYQSIHTAVVGPDNRHVEIQIRTRQMHNIAERGVAAHFKYKTGAVTVDSVFEDENLDRWMTLVREIFENAGEETTQQLIDSVKQNLFQDEIYIFTPANELKILPKKSTPLDFAYAIHTEIGSSCVGAKVNGKIVPLDYKLVSGDQVQILTSEKQEPKREWLNFVVTARAKSAVHKHLKSIKRTSVEIGIQKWEALSSDKNISLKEYELEDLAEILNFANINEFYRAIGSGDFDIDANIDYILYKITEISLVGKTLSEQKHMDFTGQNSDGDSPQKRINLSAGLINSELASCCKPLPGDKIKGILFREEEIEIHRAECSELKSITNDGKFNIFDVDWSGLEKDKYFTDIIIKGSDTQTLLEDITSIIISVNKVVMKKISFNVNESIMTIDISLVIKSREQFELLLSKLNDHENIQSVERVLA